MLSAFRQEGVPFERAWSSAVQRMRAQPTMSDEEVEELAAFKAELSWSKEWWRWAYERSPEPPPQLAVSNGRANGPPRGSEALGADPRAMATAVMNHTRPSAEAA